MVKILGLPGPNVQDPNALDAFGSPTGPSAAHPFGVDQLGRDVLSRVIYGARVSLDRGDRRYRDRHGVLGTVIGLVAGFYRGWVDTLISRIVDVFLAFPVLVLGLGIGAACGVRGCAGGLIQPGIGTVIFIIALASFTYIARIVRGQVLSLREKEFVEASRSLGASNSRIIFREILPNLMAPLIVYSSLLIPVEHPARGGAVVPGRRGPAADRELGPDDLRRLARSSTPPGGTCSSRALHCCSPCSRSTWSATACWTRSTRGRTSER